MKNMVADISPPYLKGKKKLDVIVLNVSSVRVCLEIKNNL